MSNYNGVNNRFCMDEIRIIYSFDTNKIISSDVGDPENVFLHVFVF